MTSPVAETVHSCLDLLRISWGSENCALKQTVGTLLEVSRSGGLLHIDEAIAPGTKVSIYLECNQQIDAEVQSFEQDEFGFYVALQTAGAWFPVQYWPSYMLPDTPPAKPAMGIDAERAAAIPDEIVIPTAS